jgi:hypothetical protein
MHRYETSTPRFALGLAAVAMAAITLGVFGIMPATMEAGAHEPGVLAQSTITTAASAGAASDARLDLDAIHEELASGPCGSSEPTP